MFSLIGSIFKYSLLVLTVLVLSHVIEIQGVTISQHVLNGMHWVSGYSPKQQATQITQSLTRSVQEHTDRINQIDTEPSQDQKALNQVIQKSQKR